MSKSEVLCPVETAYRQQISLAGLWYIQPDPSGVEDYALGLPKTDQVPVPADWHDVLVSPELADYCGVCWYEKNIFVPKTWLGQEVFLRLAGVGSRATVYINGVEVDRHEGMYMPATIKLTRQIRYGQENRLTIRVSNESYPYQIPGGYTPVLPRGLRRHASYEGRRPHSGLYGDVTLYAVPMMRITDIEVDTISISPDEAVLTYRVEAQGNCLVTLTVRDKVGRVVATAVGNIGELRVPQPQCWSLSNPYLYSLEVDINRIGKQHDVYRRALGIRTVSCQNGMWMLNEQHVTWRGLSARDIWGDRMTYDPIAIQRGFARLAHMGGNCIFTEGMPLPDEVYSLADTKGIAIIDETPVWGLVSHQWEPGKANFAQSDMQHRTCESHQRQVVQRLRQYKHHPSLVAMGILYNPMSLTEEDAPYIQSILGAARQVSGTLPLGMRTKLTADQVDQACLADFQWVLWEDAEHDDGLGGAAWRANVFAKVSAWDKHLTQTGLLVRMAGPILTGMQDPWMTESQWQQAMSAAIREIQSCPRVGGISIHVRNHQFQW